VKALACATLLHVQPGQHLSSVGARAKQTTMGTLLTSLLRDTMGAEACVLNGGGVRGARDYDVHFTYGDLEQEVPFENEVVVASIPGAVLREAIAASRAHAPAESGGFLQVDDRTEVAETGNLLVSIGGHPLDEARVYRVALVRNLFEGMDHIEPLVRFARESPASIPPPGSGRDVVLIRGIEPNMRWRGFCDELIELCRELQVQTVVALGALLADTPHTRPVPVSGAAYSPDSAKTFGLEETRYEGPTGIAGVFQDACVQAGIPAVTFWAAVPHYVSQPPNPKATVALLRRVEDVLDIEVPLADLPTQAEEWEQAVSEMTSEDEEIAEYVQSLEERGDAEVDMNEALGKIDGDALAAEFERYLRRRGPGFRG